MEEKSVRRYKKHIVFAIDLVACVATCAECGTVPLAFTVSREGNYPACGAKTTTTHGGKYTRRQYQLWNPSIPLTLRQNKMHTILSYDLSTMFGMCITCGRIPVKLWDSPSKRERGISHVMCMFKHATSLGIIVTPDELRFAGERGHCAICLRKFSPELVTYIDHNHTTMLFRDLLCINCNAGIGQFRDDPEVLARAADYVLRVRPTL